VTVDRNTKLGTRFQKRRYLVRTVGEYTSPADIEQIVITSRDGRPVYVRDVATVSLGYRDAEFVVRQRGFPAIAVNAQRATGANVLDAMAGLQAAVRELNDGILKERGFQLYQVYDETDYVHSALGLVEQNLVIGSLLAVVLVSLTVAVHYEVLRLVSNLLPRLTLPPRQRILVVIFAVFLADTKGS